MWKRGGIFGEPARGRNRMICFSRQERIYDSGGTLAYKSFHTLKRGKVSQVRSLQHSFEERKTGIRHIRDSSFILVSFISGRRLGLQFAPIFTIAMKSPTSKKRPRSPSASGDGVDLSIKKVSVVLRVVLFDFAISLAAQRIFAARRSRN